MFNFIYQVIRTARPRQWLKNLSLFAAPVFAGTLFTGDVLAKTLEGFFVFCAVSSGVYFMNDIIDAPRDKLHPIKKNRPIPSGKLSMAAAKIIAILLILGSIWYSITFVGMYFTTTVVVYLVIQLAYSVYFRNVIILESLFVASGFILRVFAGGFASESSISSWLILTTIGVSLLLAFGKRRSEKTLLQNALGITKSQIDTRKSLRHYPDTLLDSMISMSATFCIVAYSLFAFQVSPELQEGTLSDLLPSILQSPKFMMLTIPLVIYGVARYLYVIYERQDAESPERVLLSDKPLLATVTLWGLAIMVIIYGIPLLL